MPRAETRFDAGPHTYEVLVDGLWVRCPSVTQITKATVPVPFSAGAWYGYKMGVNAAFHSSDEWSGLDPDIAYEKAKRYENPNSVLEKAGDRGTLVHEALERWGKEGTAINPMDFEPEDRKRIEGISRWLLDNEPEVVEAEVRTASAEHLFAGTFDAYVTFNAGDHKGKRALLDWKTSKSVYKDQYFPQLSAYLEAEREAGIEPVDFSAVVHIPESGRVKLHENDGTFEDFRVLLDHYRSIEARKERERAAKEAKSS